MAQFDFTSLLIYQKALELAKSCDTIVGQLPRYRWAAGDQLSRASLSVVLNTAEGCGEFQPAEKARFYRMARRSAFETAACLQFLQRVGALDQALYDTMNRELQHIAAALTALIKSVLSRPRP